MTNAINTFGTRQITKGPAPKTARFSFGVLAAAAAIGFAMPAHAQSTGEDLEAFAIEPYVGVMGVINDFDSEAHDSGIPNSFGGDGREIKVLAV